MHRGPGEEPAQRGSALRIPHASSICAVVFSMVKTVGWKMSGDMVDTIPYGSKHCLRRY